MNYKERVDSYLLRFKAITIGAHSECHECQSLYDMGERELSHAIESLGVGDEGTFSTASCDFCGASPGYRYLMHGLGDACDQEPLSLRHLPVCNDCVSYLAFGELPFGES